MNAAVHQASWFTCRPLAPSFTQHRTQVEDGRACRRPPESGREMAACGAPPWRRCSILSCSVRVERVDRGLTGVPRGRWAAASRRSCTAAAPPLICSLWYIRISRSSAGCSSAPPPGSGSPGCPSARPSCCRRRARVDMITGGAAGGGAVCRGDHRRHQRLRRGESGGRRALQRVAALVRAGGRRSRERAPARARVHQRPRALGRADRQRPDRRHAAAGVGRRAIGQRRQAVRPRRSDV